MVSFADDIDHDAASQDERSDNDADEEMDDAVDDEADVEADADGDDGEEDDNDENDEDEDQDEADSPSQSQRQPRPGISTHTPNEQAIEGSSQSQPNPIVTLTSPSPHSSNVRSPNRVNAPFRPTVRPEALTAPVYDIVPTIAAPQSTSINAVAATSDMRYVFSGGTDGYVRMYNWIDTANGKTALTVQQRQPFVDSVTKHGVLQTYWENEEDSIRTPPLQSADEPTPLSPVYSLAVHHQALWLLSGLESGGINLVTCRHQAGSRIACLRKHTSAVSVLHMAPDETSFLSGSWDKMIYDWDLNTGTTKRSFERSGGQICAIEPRPISPLQVPEKSGRFEPISDTFASNNTLRPLPNGITVNGVKHSDRRASKDGVDATEGVVGSPDGSLFGDNGGDGGDHDSLFGSDDAGAAGQSGAAFGDDEDDEFSRAIANGIQQSEEANAEGDVDMVDAQNPGDSLRTELSNPEPAVRTEEPLQDMNGILHEDTTLSAVSAAVSSGLPHSEDPTSSGAQPNGISDIPEDSSSSETTFLDASIDGTLRIWDRRQQNPVATMNPARGTPPWCMNACWSPDGNYIYAGRRNCTVEEYSLHKGLREPSRTFKFPTGSGAVSAVRAMPNGRHLVCASHDILRLYDLKQPENLRHSAVPFLIVPGHRTGTISHLYLDPTCRFMISTAGNRGWEGSTTEVLLGYEIGIGRA
ncbi:hypothetical protein LTR04_000409 [Oleoguttula sp. CCFEE 6159]|nr:hypothetical protein LTR04_000409 [Oleoguttula sp. CCFEE 6159]